LSYDEATELTHWGKKVLHRDAMQPAKKAGIPIYVRNTSRPSHLGTRIDAQAGRRSLGKSSLSLPLPISCPPLSQPSLHLFSASSSPSDHVQHISSPGELNGGDHQLNGRHPLNGHPLNGHHPLNGQHNGADNNYFGPSLNHLALDGCQMNEPSSYASADDRKVSLDDHKVSSDDHKVCEAKSFVVVALGLEKYEKLHSSLQQVREGLSLHGITPDSAVVISLIGELVCKNVIWKSQFQEVFQSSGLRGYFPQGLSLSDSSHHISVVVNKEDEPLVSNLIHAKFVGQKE